MHPKKLPLFAVLLVVAYTASAHNYLPSVADGSTTIIPDISISRAAYRELTVNRPVDVYEFSARKGQEIYIQMTVPVLERLNGFAPDFVLVYTGEESAVFADPIVESGSLFDPAHEVVDLVRPHEGNDETEPPMLALSYAGSRDVVFDEPVTSTRYWIRQSLTVSAPVDGTYRIGVFSSSDRIGKYVLAPGKAEKFGLGDVFTLPRVRAQVREFCEQPTWPDVLVTILLAAAVTAGVIVAALP